MVIKEVRSLRTEVRSQGSGKKRMELTPQRGFSHKLSPHTSHLTPDASLITFSIGIKCPADSLIKLVLIEPFAAGEVPTHIIFSIDNGDNLRQPTWIFVTVVMPYF